MTLASLRKRIPVSPSSEVCGSALDQLERERRLAAGAAVGLVALLLLAVCGVPMAASAQPVQIVELSPHSATALVMTLADQSGPGSDTQPFAIDFGHVDAIVETRIDPTHGPVVSAIEFEAGGLWFDEYTVWQYEAIAPIPPFPTYTLNLNPRHWIGSPSTGPVDATATSMNTVTLDLSATDFVFSQGEVEFTSALGYATAGWGPSDPPVVFETEATGTATLAVDSGGYNYDVTVTIPVDGSTPLPGMDVDATLTGDLVLTGKYRIPALPIPPFVGLGIVLSLLVSGTLRARHARSRTPGS